MNIRSALIFSLVLLVVCSQTVNGQDLQRLTQLLERGSSQVETRMNPATGTAYMITVDELDVSKRAVDALDPLDSLREFLQRTPQLGIVNMDEELQFIGKTDDFQIPGRYQMSFQQKYKGLKVYGTALRVTFNENNQILSITSTIVPDLHLDVVPTIPRDSALTVARSVLTNNMTYEADKVELVVYRDGLTEGKRGTNHVAYHVTYICHEHLDVHHVFVDAHTAAVLNEFTGVHNALARYVTDYGAKTWFYSEGQAPTGNAEVETLVATSGQLYSIMRNVGGYDSWDLRGSSFKMYTNTRSGALQGWQCPNAAFISSYGASLYCPGLGNGIDVVAHEWGHGYISGLADLQYQYQSGALNEGYADIIGESVQLMTNQPTAYSARTTRGCNMPADNRRWIIGDQVSNFISSRNAAGQYIGIRDMYNPNCFGDPASTTDTAAWCSTTDNGGVHTNSGIPNQAYALFVDGGSLNGETVQGVGLLQAFHIYIRALAKHVPTSTFAQHADFLIKSCQELMSNSVNLRDPLTGAASGQIVSSSTCASLVKVLSATGLASGQFCGTQSTATPLPVFVPSTVPVATPVAVPVAAPVRVPVAAPVAAPVTPPVTRVPVSVPVAAPVAPPTTPPVRAPVAVPVSSPVTPPTPAKSARVLRGPFPSAVPASGGDVFWNTIGFNTETDDVWCMVNNGQPYKGKLVTNQWTEYSVCPTPALNSRTILNISVSSDGVNYFGPYTVRVYANARLNKVTPATGALDGGNDIIIKGHGFEQFAGCNPDATYISSPDCLVCVFGANNERVVSATYIDDSTISCPAPSWYSLSTDSTTVPFYIALNYWSLVGPLSYEYTGDVTPYISALPGVPVDQNVVSPAARVGCQSVLALLVLYIFV